MFKNERKFLWKRVWFRKMDERNGSFREMKKSSFFKNERKKTNDFNCSNELEKNNFLTKKIFF